MFSIFLSKDRSTGKSRHVVRFSEVKKKSTQTDRIASHRRSIDRMKIPGGVFTLKTAF